MAVCGRDSPNPHFGSCQWCGCFPSDRLHGEVEARRKPPAGMVRQAEESIIATKGSSASGNKRRQMQLAGDGIADAEQFRGQA